MNNKDKLGMYFPDIFNSAADYFQIPPAVTLLGPIALALALQIVKSSGSRQRLHEKGAWKGMKVENQESGIISTLCALIFIVSMTYISYYTYSSGSPTYLVSNMISIAQ